MEVVFERCAGLDVHKKSITARVLWALPKGKKKQEKRPFGTFTQDLLAMADWLRQSGVTHVAMESTGEYWKPVWNILEGQFEILLMNAQHIKTVPGRKTDCPYRNLRTTWDNGASGKAPYRLTCQSARSGTRVA